ncbi:tyrosine--tRNA ligase [Acuticoccus sp. I52.16.1]|uniref:tyrosine--tRNA ligase n=1 Tax=Acuticoccus sp. I52.16.1 TaxID=2928472 RepID=UPI001FD3D17D|nr:tyrosine--tRNA ligase [Acuticoccus sp. I52.16.1]UOM34543.1 tyrosine--tRNA ligase [Acuticoccus sp. I52.16.1]
MARSDFLHTLHARGFIHQITDEEGLDSLCNGAMVTGYIGFDLTAPSLHVGHLVQIMMLHWLQQTGGRPIALMGGGTSKIGDPSGRDTTRQLMTAETIAENKASIFKVFNRFVDFTADAIAADNAEWLDGLEYVPFLRDVGRHFSVNRMLTMDSVRLRLDREQPLTFLEFNYMVLQAYDFVELNRRYGCVVQMGGSDQWGNIVSGIDLGRRITGAELYGVTAPLITKSDGTKMGKTAGGAVWLNADMLRPYDYWQFWRNTGDADVARFLKLFTTLPLHEIERLAALQGSEINEAKKVLANEATALVHGREAAEGAAETAATTFEAGGIAEGLPTVDVSQAELAEGVGVLAAFVRSGLAASNSEARRAIQGGGARVNDDKLTDDKRLLGTADVVDGVIKLSLGKKKHALLRPV